MAVTPYEEKKYTQSDKLVQAQQDLQNLQNNKPADYQSQYQTGLNSLMDQIQNRPSFSYDVNSDALYQQVAQNYLQQGKQAMMDTVGQASALTGGYGNSYAMTAGQQQYNQHLLGLTEMIPQFQQMAFDQYQAEGDDLINRYSLMLQQDENAYSRYQDALALYYADLDRKQSAYESERDYDYDRFADDRDFDYGKYQDDLEYDYQLSRDQVSDDQWLKEYEYQQERDRIEDEQWQKEYDETVRQFNEELEWDKEQYYYTGSSSSSGSSGSSGGSGGSSGSDDDSMSLPMAAAQVAKEYSVEDAVNWVNSQKNVPQAEKNAAIQNAKGVDQTEYWRKRAAAMG